MALPRTFAWNAPALVCLVWMCLASNFMSPPDGGGISRPSPAAAQRSNAFKETNAGLEESPIWWNAWRRAHSSASMSWPRPWREVCFPGALWGKGVSWGPLRPLPAGPWQVGWDWTPERRCFGVNREWQPRLRLTRCSIWSAIFRFGSVPCRCWTSRWNTWGMSSSMNWGLLCSDLWTLVR